MLVHPQSQLLREPRLLVPGMQPLGGVKINQTHPLSRGLIDGLVAGKRFIANGQTIANASIVAGANGRYLKLSGSASYIQLPAVPINTNVLSFTFGVAVASQNGEMLYELSANCDSATGFYIYGLNASIIRVQSNGGVTSHYSDLTFTFPATMTWHTLVVNVANNPHVYSLYQSGRLIATFGPLTANAGTFSPQPLNIGSRNASSLFSDGTFGDVFIHNIALTPVQIAALHNDPYQLLTVH